MLLGTRRLAVRLLATYLPLGLFLAIGGWVAWSYRDFTYDDPWITYRVAENIITGRGFVYNVGERVLVTTTPLYTLILAGLGLLFKDIPYLSLIIGAVSYTAGGALLFAIGKKRGQPGVGALAGLFYLLLPLMPLTLPMETPFLLMLGLLALYFALSFRWNLAAASLALAVITRPDAAVLAGVLFVYYILRQRRLPIGPPIVFLALVAPWFLFSHINFGSLSPATLEAKQAFRAAGWGPDFISMTLRWGREVAQENPLYWLLLPASLSGVLLSLLRERWVLVAIAWAAIHAAAYQWLAVPWFHWYMAPLFPALAVTSALGLVWITHAMGWKNYGKQAPLVIGILFATITVVPWGQRLLNHPFIPTDPVNIAYKEIGLWLRNNANPEASVGVTEFGIIGYHSGLKIIDFPGLTNPQQAAALGRKDVAWSVFNLWPDYLILYDGLPFDENLKSDPRFQAHYAPLRSFPVASPRMSGITVYGLWTTGGRAKVTKRDLKWNFGDALELRAYAIEKTSVRPADVLRLALVWGPLQRSSLNYSVFAHILDIDNRMVAQQDNVPQTTTWLPWSEYKDYHAIQLPSGLAPGRYSLQVGVYLAEKMENLPVLENGLTKTASLALANIEVLP